MFIISITHHISCRIFRDLRLTPLLLHTVYFLRNIVSQPVRMLTYIAGVFFFIMRGLLTQLSERVGARIVVAHSVFAERVLRRAGRPRISIKCD